MSDTDQIERLARLCYEVLTKRNSERHKMAFHSWDQQTLALREDWRAVAQAIVAEMSK